VDGDTDAAMEARIRMGLNKFRYLIPLLTSMDISLIIEWETVQQLCVKQYVAWK